MSPSIHSRVLPYLLSVESVVKSELNCGLGPDRVEFQSEFKKKDNSILVRPYSRERERVCGAKKKVCGANCSFVFFCSYNQFLRLPKKKKKKKKKEKRKDSKEKKGGCFSY